MALYAIRFTKRTEKRLKNNFTKMQGMMTQQINKTETLLEGMEKEAENIRDSVQKTKQELLDSIKNVDTIREELLESLQSLEDSCIIKEDENKK